MDIEKIIKQLSEEGRKVPDNRKQIINKAKAEGLLTDNTLAPKAVSNGGRAAAAVKNNRIIAAVASAFVLGTVAAAAIIPVTMGNNGSLPPLGPVLCTEELGTDYAVGAVSTAKLLGCFGIGGSAETAVAKPARVTREALVEREPDMETQINNFGSYMGAFGAFYGADEELVEVSEAPAPSAKYPFSIQIRGRYANGERADFAMYYLEALDFDYKGDGDKYYLEGEIVIDTVNYYLEGERTFITTDGSAEAYDLVLRAYPDAKNRGDYVQMTMGVNPASPQGKSYDYKVYKGGNAQSQTLTYLPSFEQNKAFDLVLNYGGGDSKFTVYRPEEGKPVLTVGYEIGTKRSSFKVSQTRGEAPCIMMKSFIYSLNEAAKTCTVTGYKAGEVLDEELEIPEEVTVKNEIYKVVEIGYDAFAERNELKKVIIPSGVKKIVGNAFKYCKNLEEVEFSEGLEDISYGAFWGCSSLKSIDIPASVTSLAGSAFTYCSGLESISVDAANQKYSGEGNCLVDLNSLQLFQGCVNSVIPQDKGIREISSMAFINTAIGAVTIPATVGQIGDNAFNGCARLERIDIPASVLYISPEAFANCVKLSEITLPDTGIEISEKVFYNTAYKNDPANWDGDVGYEALYIGKHLIYLNKIDIGTSLMANVVMKPDTLTIADRAFNVDVYSFGMSNTVFQSIRLSGSLLYIGHNAVIAGEGCMSLEMDGETSRYVTVDNCLIDKNERVILAGCSNSKIPQDENVKIIGEYAFAGSSLYNISIPANIAGIERCAFAGSSISVITIPKTVRGIGDDAFLNCYNLREVIFENYNENDKEEDIASAYLHLNSCFINCDNLERVVLPKHLLSAASLFRYCDNLKTVDITYNPNNNSLAGFALYSLVEYCYNFDSVTFSGTIAEWNACYHDSYGLNFLVHCSDGDITPDFHQ